MSVWYSVAENDDKDQRLEVTNVSFADGLDVVIRKCAEHDNEIAEISHDVLHFTLYETEDGPAVAEYAVRVEMVPKVTANRII